jgi:hypothetical protein
MAPGAHSLEVKRPGLEADHSLPSSAEVKNAWSYNTTRQYACMAWFSVKKCAGTTLNLPGRFALVLKQLPRYKDMSIA